MAAIIDVVQSVAQIARRCPTQTLVHAYARAARKLCRESRWYVVNINGQVVANQETYSLGSDPQLEIVGIKAMQITDPRGQAHPVNKSDPTQWRPTTQRGMPRWYAYIPEAGFAVYLKPDRTYPLLVTAQVAPKQGVTHLPDDLLVKWDQTFEHGALAYLLNIPNQPWTDPIQAEANRRAFQAGIANAKADAQRSYNTGTVMANARRIL